MVAFAFFPHDDCHGDLPAAASATHHAETMPRPLVSPWLQQLAAPAPGRDAEDQGPDAEEPVSSPQETVRYLRSRIHTLQKRVRHWKSKALASRRALKKLRADFESHKMMTSGRRGRKDRYFSTHGGLTLGIKGCFSHINRAMLGATLSQDVSSQSACKWERIAGACLHSESREFHISREDWAGIVFDNLGTRFIIQPTDKPVYATFCAKPTC